MADPATIGMAVKAAVTALSDERLRKGLYWTITAILSPLIIVFVLILGLLSGTAQHNRETLDMCLNGVTIPQNVPEDYAKHIEEMKKSFTELDNEIAVVDSNMKDGEHIDTSRVKAVFYTLYFDSVELSDIDCNKFVGCFAEEKELTKIVTDSKGNIETEIYTEVVPVKNMKSVYLNIASKMGRIATEEEIANAYEVYWRMKYGKAVPSDGLDYEDFIKKLPLSQQQIRDLREFISPIGNDWRNKVTRVWLPKRSFYRSS